MKHVKQVLLGLLLLILAIVLTINVPALGHPQITQLSGEALLQSPQCNFPANYVLQVPTHNNGFPFGYNKHFTLGGCGYSANTTWLLFVLDIVIWLFVLIVLVSIIGRLKRRKL
jgi:hypothetical protein